MKRLRDGEIGIDKVSRVNWNVRKVESIRL